jgi:hypothetical protein
MMVLSVYSVAIDFVYHSAKHAIVFIEKVS